MCLFKYSFINTDSPNSPFLSIPKHSLNILTYPIPCNSAFKLNSSVLHDAIIENISAFFELADWFENKNPRQSVLDLMLRNPKHEQI